MSAGGVSTAAAEGPDPGDLADIGVPGSQGQDPPGGGRHRRVR